MSLKIVEQLMTATGVLQKPLPVMQPNSEIDFSRASFKELTGEQWQHRDRGRIETLSNGGVELDSSVRYDSWPVGAPSDGDYVQFGTVTGYLPIDRQDWQAYNTLCFTIKSECQNVINPNVTIAFKNDGRIKVPDKYHREGVHSVNLIPDGAREYTLNIADLPRDAITEINVSTAANGSYLDLPGHIKLQITDLKLAKASTSRHSSGWQLPVDQFGQTQVGFTPTAIKRVLVPKEITATKFSVNDEKQQTVFSGELQQPAKSVSSGIRIADFSPLQAPGRYQVQVGELTSLTFKIDPAESLWDETVLKTLNFIYSERCGFPVPGIHGVCHVDVTAQHNGKTISFNGGWHDAGDLSQQTVHSGEVALSLLESAARYRQSEPQLAQRLETEAFWGLDFVLKMRFCDGYRATSAGVSRWTDNQIGNMDDAKARVHNNPYENYLFAGIFAKSAQLVENPQWRQRLTQVAQTDFEFAQTEFKRHPYQDEPIMWEHTYNTSKSVYNATVAWAAGHLFEITTNSNYRKISEAFGQKLLDCQESVGIKLIAGGKLSGFFYRDDQHQVVQHFNHQAREHLIGAALAELIHNASFDSQSKWVTSARAYGDYLKFLQVYTQPYPMLAAGVYLDDEYQDSESFYKQNLLVDKTAETEFQKQLQRGEKLGEHLYLKRFPVWFSFRGNNGVLLSAGLSAANLGQALGDHELTQIGVNQLQWLTGENPFSQSLIYGVGQRFESQYTVSSGEMVGEIPVGIETSGNADEPYWPQFNNATYKEVWISNAGKVLSLIAKVLQMEGA